MRDRINSRSRRRRIVIAGAVTALAAAGALTVQTLSAPTVSAQPSGCETIDRYSVCTTFPADGEPDTTITDELARHIDATADGDSIRVAMYTWELKDGDSNGPEEVANALVDAQQRGVNVRVVIGDQNAKDRNKALRELLDNEKVPFVVCPDACMDTSPNGRRGAMHNKLFLIEHGGSKNVLVTSSNLTHGQVSKYQNLLVSRDDEKQFDYLTKYWNRLADKSWRGWGDRDRAAKGDHDGSKAYVFWRENNDPVLGNLNNVTDCNSEHNRVWVAASMGGRDPIRERLVELQEAGCDVRVLITPGEGNKNEEWLQATGLSKAKVKDMPGNHNKFILVDAEYAGEWRSVVWTGSHNHLNGGSSLHDSNDVNLRLIRPDVFGIYAEYFMSMYDNTND